MSSLFPNNFPAYNNFLDDNDVKNVKSTFQIVPLCHTSGPSGNQPFDMLSMCE